MQAETVRRLDYRFVSLCKNNRYLPWRLFLCFLSMNREMYVAHSDAITLLTISTTITKSSAISHPLSQRGVIETEHYCPDMTNRQTIPLCLSHR